MLIAKTGVATLLTVLLTTLLTVAATWLLTEVVSSAEADAIAAAQRAEYLELIRDGHALAGVQVEF